MQKAFIRAIEYYLPEAVLDNDVLALEFPEFPAAKILEKTGIKERHIAAPNEYASDMAIKAAQRLFESRVVSPEQIDFLLFCTQTPDYLLPTSACLIQDRLGLLKTTGALDFNLGCSGYVYGLSLAKALIESNQARNILLLTGDTYTKLIDPTDKTVKTIFGDGASATLIISREVNATGISSAALGTDGSGGDNLCMKSQGLRKVVGQDSFLRMQGPKIFEFTLDVVPKVIDDALLKAALRFEDIELFVFHQANAYMLEHLRKKLNIPHEKFWVAMAFCGNTVSSAMPIALKEAQKAGILTGKNKVMLVGFGVGYSWAANIVNFNQFYFNERCL